MERDLTQGEIIWFDFDPVSGHETAGRRPALVVSNNTYNSHSSGVMLCPISNTTSDFPTYVPLDARTKTTGKVLCDHIRTIDPRARNYELAEVIPQELLRRVLGIIMSILQVEQ